MKTILTVAIIPLLLIACASGKTAGDASIRGKYWKLTEVSGTSLSEVQLSREPFIIFSSMDDRLSGNAGCNNFFGGFQIKSGNVLAISPIGSTKMACPDMTVEQKLLQALPLATSFTAENNRLILKDANNTVLARFEAGNRQ